MIDDIIAKGKEIMDYNKDGAVDHKDLKQFGLDYIAIFVGMLLSILSVSEEEIITMINTETWNWGFFFKILVLTSVSAFFYLFKRKVDKEKKELTVKVDELQKALFDAQNDRACDKLDHVLEMKTKEQEMAVLNLQMRFALDQKTAELNKH